MSKISKRIKETQTKIEKKLYKANEALQVLKLISTAKFNETAEAHIALRIDPKYNDQKLRSTVMLPKGNGKEVKIAVITRQEPSEVLAMGADIVGDDELVTEILKTGKFEFDQLITTPDMMPLIAKLGRVLGPRGLMPSPKAGTVTVNIKEAITEFKSGKLEYRADRTGIVHVPFGKLNFPEEDLLINLEAIQESIDKNKPPGVKGNYWKSFYITTTMSPSIQMEVSAFRDKIFD